MVDILVLLSCRLSVGVSELSRSVQPGGTLGPLGTKSSENPSKETGNHPPNLSDGEDVDSLPVQVDRRLRQDLNIDNPGVFDILLH